MTWTIDVRGRSIDEVSAAVAQARAEVPVPEGVRCWTWIDAETGQPEAVLVEIDGGEGEGE